MTIRQYFVVFSVVSLATLTAFWILVDLDFANILPIDYAFTQAHRDLIAKCDVGDLTLLGDSTAVSDLIPSRIGQNVADFGIAGTTPVETYYEIESILRCPNKPKAVIFSYTPTVLMDAPENKIFTQATFYWTRGLGFHIVNYTDALSVLRWSNRLQDRSIVGPKSLFNIDYTVKAFLYRIDFPSYFFEQVLAAFTAHLLGNKTVNSASRQFVYAQTLADNGHHFLGMSATALGSLDGYAKVLKSEPSNHAGYRVVPIVNMYLSLAIKRLTDAGVKVYIIEPPRSSESVAYYSKGTIDGYQNYLLSLQNGSANVVLLDHGFNSWNPSLFGDAAHLNLRGALAYSDIVREELLAAGRSDLAFKDDCTMDTNLYRNDVGSETSPLSSKDVNQAPTDAAVMPFPQLRCPEANQAGLYGGKVSKDFYASPLSGTPSVMLDAGKTYAVAVFIKNISATQASLKLNWPGVKGRVTWDFNQRQITYSDLANRFNSGALLCPDGWTELFLAETTGARAGAYPGPQILLSGAGTASAYVFGMSVQHGLWPTNYCALRAGETTTISAGN